MPEITSKVCDINVSFWAKDKIASETGKMPSSTLLDAVREDPC